MCILSTNTFDENHSCLAVCHELRLVTFDNGLGQSEPVGADSEDQLPLKQIAITDESIKRPGFLPKMQTSDAV